MVKKSAKGSSKEMRARANRIDLVASIFGHNELAKLATTLGEKVYHNLVIQTLEQRLKEAGGELNIEHKPTILTLPHYPLHINFAENDIELMRQAVKEHDEKKGSTNT